MTKLTNHKLEIKVVLSDKNSEMIDKLEKIILRELKSTSQKLPIEK